MVELKYYGDDGLLVEFEEKIDPEINNKVHALHDEIKKEEIKSVRECVPTYRSILINYDPTKIGFEDFKQKIKEIVKRIENREFKSIDKKKIKIPTIYGGKFGPDLKDVANKNNISKDEVIEIHSNQVYRVYMMGFTPGFAYLGGMSEKISTPRLKDPRKKIPRGSVGIGGDQTGIYPIESPGGWRVIGRTPIRLFNPEKDPPVAFEPADRIKFVPINEERYKEILNEQKSGDNILEMRSF